MLGRRVSQVVCGRDGRPARLEVPDPRYFALQKLWMAEQIKRRADKRPKDAKQGKLVLDAVAAHMPLYPLDAEFRAGLPVDLQPYFDRWKAGYSPLGETVRRQW